MFGTQNYGLNIENHSWSFEDESLELRKAVRTAFALNTVLVASRGNQGVFEARYPACFNDDWVISVGGSANRDTINGLVGAFKTRYNGDFWWQSNYGRGVDIVAPSSMYTKPQIGSFTSRDSVSIFTTNPRGFPAKDSLMNSDYTGFNGTSAAAPHVSGVAALMLSLHNNKRGYPNNLAPEDVEFILQKYATDIVGTGLIDSFVRDTAEKYVLRPNDTTRVTYPVGYDDYNGWGRLNAGASLRMIDTPRYQILHPTDAPTSFSKTLVRSNANIALLDKVNNVDAGNYVADVYRAQEQYTYNTLTNWRIVDAWRRVSSSKGYADTINIRDEPWLNFNATINASRNQVNVTASSYFYKIGTNWVPFHPDSIKKFRYSVHLENLNATDAQEVTKTIKKFNVFPNPTSGRITIDYQLEQMPSNLHVEIFDVAGRLVQRSEMPQLLNATFTLDIPNLAQGIYVVRLTADGDSLYKKLIKL